MSLLYIKRIFEDKDYYINDNFDFDSLMKLQKDIEQAKKDLKEMELLIYEQVNKIQNVVKYNEIICRREKRYNDRVRVIVYVNTYMMQDGIRLKKDNSVYGSMKEFKGNEKKQAKEYALKLNKELHYPVRIENWK